MPRIKKITEEQPKQKNELFFKDLSDIPRDGKTYLTKVQEEIVVITWHDEENEYSYLNRRGERRSL